ncbi:MAG: response regulator [Gammaproteobacteria bacterium]|nr:response regulator [Gammaproteobacteria bacterium]
MPAKPLKRILYAEDEDDIRVIAQIALEELGGFVVKYCNTGVEVLEVAESFAPDLFLLDVMMPEMDGITTLEELHKIAPLKKVPAIFMTAKIQSNEIAEYKTMGILGVINKPFDPMMLAQTINEMWESQP